MLPRKFPESPLALPIAAALPLIVLAAALWVRADPADPPFQGLDDAWLRLMAGSDEGPLWFAAVSLDLLGGWVGRIIEAVIVIVLLAGRRWRSALYLVSALLGAYLATGALKLIGDRPRPADRMIEIASLSFPSGHASHEAAFVVVLAVVAIPLTSSKRWWPLAAVLVLAMMWSRTWLHAHWLTDTIGGAAAGVGIAMLAWWAFAPLLERERSIREDLARRNDVPDAPAGLRFIDALPDEPRGHRCPPPIRAMTSPRRRHRRLRAIPTRRPTATTSRRGPTTAWRSPRWSSASSAPATRSASSA